VIVLGSTGSIGINTLAIAKRYGLDVEILVAGHNLKQLNEQIHIFNPKQVVIADSRRRHEVNHSNVLSGEEGILHAISDSKSELMVNALVGFLGLKPTLEGIKNHKKIALANKESLVVAGKFIDTSAVFPIDSEHFGLWYLQRNNTLPFKKLILTASGGAFRNTPLQDIKNASFQDALNHPNWKMGPKITIDSATMVNKLFELLEARWLFNCVNLDAIIETQSIIHAMIEYHDGSTTAHMAHANMQLPIAFALLNRVEESIIQPIDFPQLGHLEFKRIDIARYPIWELKQDMVHHAEKGVIVNAANEVAIDLFLNKKIPFTEIAHIILRAYESFLDQSPSSLDDIFELDQTVRKTILMRQ
jgi:1-deoxy-D-xylulose-5-phosphate reductoisomerase